MFLRSRLSFMKYLRTVCLDVVWIMRLFDQMFHWPMKMERSNKISILIFLMTFTSCGSGFDLPQPVKLDVDMLDGEVRAVWDRPDTFVDAPLKVTYNVQMERYYHLTWTNVTGCMGIEATYCKLTDLIDDYGVVYKVRVQLMTRDEESKWTKKRFYPNQSKLRPPSFTLVATSTSLTVKVHTKPIFKKLFPLGVTYTIYLQERRQENKTTPVDPNNSYYIERGETKTFDSLKWGTEYCVSIMVASIASISTSHVSPQECLLLPEQEWYIVAVTSLPIIGVLTILAIVLAIILCFLWHPEKTPVTLKSPQSGWSPLIAMEAPVETVTDKGWFLQTVPRGQVKDWVSMEMITPDAYANEGGEKGQSPTRIDSGVSSMQSTENHEVSQADSGCGSMGRSESSSSYDRVNTNSTRKREDSGVGIGCPMDCSESVDVRDADPLSVCLHTGIPKPAITTHCHSPVPKPDRALKPCSQSGGASDGNTYRTQSPPAMQLHDCDGEGSLKQICTDTTTNTELADAVSSYRAGPLQPCVCSGTYQCVWCQTTEHYRTEEDTTPYRNPHAGDGFLSSCRHIVGTSSEQDLSFPSYHPKTETIVVSMGGPEASPSLLDVIGAFPLLTALSSLPSLVDGAISCSTTNTVSLSLCDVKLLTD